MQEHAREHGRGPKQTAWASYTPDHPAFEAVRRVFGSWRKGIAAAGVQPGGGRDVWTRDFIVQAMLDWHFEHGQPPRVVDWKKAGGKYPSEATCRKYFGTFNRALAAAGLTPRRRGSRYPIPLVPTGLRSTVWAEPLRQTLCREIASGRLACDLAELSGVSERLIGRVLAGQDRVEAGAADRILSAIGRPDLHSELEAA